MSKRKKQISEYIEQMLTDKFVTFCDTKKRAVQLANHFRSLKYFCKIEQIDHSYKLWVSKTEFPS